MYIGVGFSPMTKRENFKFMLYEVGGNPYIHRSLPPT